jgi:phosphoglucomutase
MNQISEIKMAQIPDVDLTKLGITKFGDFIVEVIDPVSDYLELLKVM